MSRYIASNDSGENFAYGFDRPLSEYFLQKYVGDEVIDLVGFPLKGNKTAFLNAIEQNNVKLPDHHLQCVCLDLPFEDTLDQAIFSIYSW